VLSTADRRSAIVDLSQASIERTQSALDAIKARFDHANIADDGRRRWPWGSGLSSRSTRCVGLKDRGDGRPGATSD
jgi:hypothetical protein